MGKDLIMFAIIWYSITIVTYGISVPAGIFLPGIIVGATLGKWYTYAFSYIFKDTNYFIYQKYMRSNALLGATAMLAGYSRMSYSLIVIMLETTDAFNLYLPLLICMLSSYCTALIFNKSLYNRALRGK